MLLRTVGSDIRPRPLSLRIKQPIFISSPQKKNVDKKTVVIVIVVVVKEFRLITKTY